MSYDCQRTVNWLRCQQKAIIFMSTEREYLSLSPRLDEEELNSVAGSHTGFPAGTRRFLFAGPRRDSPSLMVPVRVPDTKN